MPVAAEHEPLRYALVGTPAGQRFDSAHVRIILHALDQSRTGMSSARSACLDSAMFLRAHDCSG